MMLNRKLQWTFIRGLLGMLCLGMGLLTRPSAAWGAEDEVWEILSLNPDSLVSLQVTSEQLTFTNGVSVTYRDTVLTARMATFNRNTKEVLAKGEVRIQRGLDVWTGDELRYNFDTKAFEGVGFKTGQVPFFAQGKRVVSLENPPRYVVEEAVLTTDDYDEPGYSVRARKVTLVPGEWMRAEGATVRIGSLPVFYMPIWKRSLKRHPNFWVVVPGYRSSFGPYALLQYNYFFDEHWSAAMDLDYRQKRGFGYGPHLRYDLPRWGNGEVKYYRTHDDRPGLDALGRPIDDDRERISYLHDSVLGTNLTLKAAVRWQSDARVIRDFFESEYRQNVQPSTFVEMQKAWRNWHLNGMIQARVNDFFDTVERLPDLKLSGLRQQLGNSPLYYESESSMGYYRRLFAEGTSNSFGAFRADTYHQIVLPRTFFNWLNVTPRVGGRATHYGEVDGKGSSISEEDRFVFNTGAEVSTKASRVWPQVKNQFFDIHGLRHIIQPSLNYVYVPSPSRTPRELASFDYEVPSRRLLPIEYPDYNAIDSIDSQNVLRLGLRNLLQTKRDGQVDDFIHWALYSDWRIDPRPDQGTFSDAYSDLDVSPFHWMTLSSELRYSLDDDAWREINHEMLINPTPNWSFSIGHRYLQNQPIYGPDYGNNLISTRVYYKVSENWGARVSHHFEARDGTLEEQQYSLYRDFRSWTAALTFRVREGRGNDPTDYTIGVMFSLKAFPRFKMGQDQNEPSSLLGY